jgi:Flp pilus assembly protein TadG
MRRVKDDDGAIAVIVAVLAVVLFGFGALVVDAGALYDERRQLQNGADGAALALAQSCAAGPCGTVAAQSSLAQPYANGNARDGGANLKEVCGAGHPDLVPCADPPTVPGNGYVKVQTQTGTASTASKMPPLLARALDPSYTGTTVGASSVANWGAPGGAKSSIPFTFGDCEWEHYTNSGATYAGPIVAPSWPGPEAVIHMTGGSLPCPGSPSGGDSSGGFGWLGGDGSTCTEVTVVNDFVGNSTGAGSGASCDWHNLIGKTVHIPVFDCHTDTDVVDPDLTPGPPKTCHGQGAPPEKGTSTRYHVVGYAAFYMTGLRVPGAAEKSIVTGNFPCSGSEKCISGYFIKGLLPTGGPVTSGPSFGSTVIGLAQ